MAAEIFVVTSDRELIAIDPLNLTSRLVGKTSTMMTDVAFAPDGTLYGISYGTLYKIDPKTAKTTHVGNLGISGANALEIDKDGNAYLASANNSKLYSVNLLTGKLSSVGSYSSSATSEGDLAFFGGSLYLTTTDHQIKRLDPLTGELLGSVNIGVSDMYGLEQSGSTLYGFADNKFYAVDPSTGKLIAMTEVNGFGDFNGAASFDFTTVNTKGITVTGTKLADWLFGGDGADKLDGLAGADKLYGGVGNDKLYGRPGSDILDGGVGADVMAGGTGNDIYIVENKNDSVVENSGEGIDQIRTYVSFTLSSNVEELRLYGSNAINGTGNTLANTIIGNSKANILKGLAGNDLIKGGAGGDILYGGTGHDTIDGGAGVDRLHGDSGDDSIYGGLDSDYLTGGSGKDTFVYKSTAESNLERFDMITDFRRSEGDRVDLRAIDSNDNLDGNQAFIFIGSKAMSGTAGELRWEKVTSGTWILGDTDGDGDYDFGVHFDNITSLAKSDFLL